MLYDFKEGLKHYETMPMDDEEAEYHKWYESDKYECDCCRKYVLEEQIKIKGEYEDICQECWEKRNECTDMEDLYMVER